ncbi:N-acetylglucosamine-6-phosphate deacetylase [Petropleomorpha daqingensis]|uniref:N-acetylglucosamine-6-phosphate deacetylase n=1 Tax=Petropleomorpha daqingensis TaxID=2026353 RepID=A0A853CGH8_9ACTN|nr:N-acetylglucosamine-6-phosphate deacetylase [Petropleomorpha daqingensis]NYJ06920.1 N-acetylglucosamine-6-phosphate deacetylase [Petropleomorpha daqingensis]
MSTLLTGGRALDADGRADGRWVLLDGATIAATGTGEPPSADETVDLAGAWLTPGFVDLHVHGGGGHAFDDGPSAIRAGLAVHRAHGTTRSLVSLVAAPVERLESALAAIAELDDPLVLGAHLEGPFLAAARCGAHDPRHLRAPSPGDVDRLLAAGAPRMVTLAPELPGGLDAVRRLAGAGVTVAVGHTEADLTTTAAAFDAGARVLTHAFNAMPGLGHREPGPVGAAVRDEWVTIELILDGAHVHPVVAGLLMDGAPGRVALVSDAMAAAGGPDGGYRLGGQEITVHDGVAVLAGTTTLAGSTLTLDRALRNALRQGVDPVAAVTAVTATPARALGLGDRLGRLAPGYAADVVVLDDDWTVRAVWAAGVRVAATPA